MSKFGEYVKSSYDELVHKVSWPSFKELQSSAVVVAVAALVIAVVVLIQHERALRSHCPYNLVTIAVKEFLLAWLELPFASCTLNPRSMKQTGIMLSGSSKTLRVSSGK